MVLFFTMCIMADLTDCFTLIAVFPFVASLEKST
jgi:hypothetical protein